MEAPKWEPITGPTNETCGFCSHGGYSAGEGEDTIGVSGRPIRCGRPAAWKWREFYLCSECWTNKEIRESIPKLIKFECKRPLVN